MQSRGGRQFEELTGPLLANDNQAEFHRAAFRYVQQLLDDQQVVRLLDHHDDEPDDQSLD